MTLITLRSERVNVLFVFTGCHSHWDVVDSLVFQYQVGILENAFDVDSVLFVDSLYCIQSYTQTTGCENTKVLFYCSCLKNIWGI